MTCPPSRITRRPLPSPAAAAFTLVELIVVLSVIVILIALLLPGMSRARQYSEMVACTTNLRQIGAAVMMYAQEQRGYLPAGYARGYAWGADPAGADTFSTVLVSTRYISAPVSKTAGDLFGSSVFRCPSGLDQATWVPVGTTRAVAAASGLCQGWTDSTYPGAGGVVWHLPVWYSANAVTNQVRTWEPFDYVDTSPLWPDIHVAKKLSAITTASTLVGIYDGCGIQNATDGRIAARHMRNRITNVMFMDFHVESVPNDQILPVTQVYTAGKINTMMPAR